MKLLLDTHIWVWSHLEPERLTRRVSRALRDRSSELWLSPVSTWEVTTLAERGRLALEPDVETWIRRALQIAPVHEAALSHDIAVESTHTGLEHRDPADRLLVATARVLGLVFVTSDDRILKHAAVKTMRN